MAKQLPDVLDFTPKAESRIATAFQRFWHSPRFYGWENVSPNQPALYVGNHTIYGMLDAPIIIEEVYLQTGIFLRALADRLHFEMPYGKLLLEQGAILGTRENCSRLMEAGQSILVFPGGGREVAKRKGEEHKLTWKKRTGFARMAIQHGYPIIPVASVGPDDCYDIKVDANDVMNSWVGTILKKTGIAKKYLRDGDMIMPIALGLGGTPLPKPERFYFSFGTSIPTKPYSGRENEEEALWEVREKVEKALYSQIDELKQIQAKDPARHLKPVFK